MRKKTIKFYFFNNAIKNPATNYLFCFSKRAIKQNKQLSKFRSKLSNIQSKRRRAELIDYVTKYKNMVRYKINLNQWHKSFDMLKHIYMFSFFTHPGNWSTKSNSIKDLKSRLMLWFLFKYKFNKFMRFFLKRYTKIGFLSSHFVHILSKKNLTYQTRSKYRAHNYNLNGHSYNITRNIKQMIIYNHLLNALLYNFTANISKRTNWYDDMYNFQTSEWSRAYAVNTAHTAFGYGSYGFPIKHEGHIYQKLEVLLANQDLLTKYFVAEDRTQKELLWANVCEKIGENVPDYIMNFNLLITNANCYFDNCFYEAHLYKQLIIYDNII
jgi:hypothetical protein